MIPEDQSVELSRMVANAMTAPRCPICACILWKEVTRYHSLPCADGSYITDGTREMACRGCGLVLKFLGDV